MFFSFTVMVEFFFFSWLFFLFFSFLKRHERDEKLCVCELATVRC